MLNKFRAVAPVRSCTKTYANYRSFKSDLAKDFNNRCGYTDCPDFWFGGKNNFHIDHFKPWKKYPNQAALETSYSNLVYSCSYVNILKSDDTSDYLDPCDIDYNTSFCRDDEGNIYPHENDEVAKYMYIKLKLYLRRYQLIWKLEQIRLKMKELGVELDAGILDGELYKKAKFLLADLGSEYIKYEDYLIGHQ